MGSLAPFQVLRAAKSGLFRARNAGQVQLYSPIEADFSGNNLRPLRPFISLSGLFAAGGTESRIRAWHLDEGENVYYLLCLRSFSVPHFVDGAQDSRSDFGKDQ